MKIVQILEFLTFIARKVMFWKNNKQNSKQGATKAKDADNYEK